MIELVLNIFRKFADENFVVCFLVIKELKEGKTEKGTRWSGFADAQLDLSLCCAHNLNCRKCCASVIHRSIG